MARTLAFGAVTALLLGASSPTLAQTAQHSTPAASQAALLPGGAAMGPRSFVSVLWADLFGGNKNSKTAER